MAERIDNVTALRQQGICPAKISVYRAMLLASPSRGQFDIAISGMDISCEGGEVCPSGPFEEVHEARFLFWSRIVTTDVCGQKVLPVIRKQPAELGIMKLTPEL
jgi:hypothetical protein